MRNVAAHKLSFAENEKTVPPLERVLSIVVNGFVRELNRGRKAAGQGCCCRPDQQGAIFGNIERTHTHFSVSIHGKGEDGPGLDGDAPQEGKVDGRGEVKPTRCLIKTTLPVPGTEEPFHVAGLLQKP